MGPTDEMTCSLPSGPPDTLKKMMETTARSPSLFGAGLACGDRGAAPTGTSNSSGAIEVCLCNGGGALAAPLPADITAQKGMAFRARARIARAEFTLTSNTGTWQVIIANKQASKQASNVL